MVTSHRALPLGVVAGIALAGCVSAGTADFPTDVMATPASGVPPAFEFAVPPAANTCRNPGTDPRDGTRITLVRSRAERGDYEVPAGRYGVSGSQLLRLDCATGAVVGIVPR